MTIQDTHPRQTEPEAGWQRIERRELGRSRRATLYADTYRLPDGSERPNYFVVDERSGTLVVAITDQDEVLLVGQYRPGVGSFLWELPAGALEPGETDPERRARAELREETGYVAAEWHALGTFHAAPHRSTETDYAYLALGARLAGDQALDPGESVRVRLVPVAEVEHLLDAGEIRSAPAIVALSRALRARDRLAARANVDV